MPDAPTPLDALDPPEWFFQAMQEFPMQATVAAWEAMIANGESWWRCRNKCWDCWRDAPYRETDIRVLVLPINPLISADQVGVAGRDEPESKP